MWLESLSRVPRRPFPRYAVCLCPSCLLRSTWSSVETSRRPPLRVLTLIALENDPPAGFFIPGRSSPLLLCNVRWCKLAYHVSLRQRPSAPQPAYVSFSPVWRRRCSPPPLLVQSVEWFTDSRAQHDTTREQVVSQRGQLWSTYPPSSTSVKLLFGGGSPPPGPNTVPPVSFISPPLPRLASHGAPLSGMPHASCCHITQRGWTGVVVSCWTCEEWNSVRTARVIFHVTMPYVR